jgi:serine/threonine protein phosphatase PrpC
MGNLLGAPVTDKETHRGVTKDEQLKFGLSSMQGWRVHMEDAHIAEGELYALEADGTKIPLVGHALFAVYDGHGGTFAAIYSGNNFLRVLSKQSKFVQYAKMCAANNNSNNNSNSNNTNNRTAKMRVLEQALKQAFVETDYEIGLAIRGKSHADANSPYHAAVAAAAAVSAPSQAVHSIDSVPSDESSENNHQHSNAHTTPNAKPAMAGAAMKAASDHLSAIEDEGDSGTTSCVVIMTPDSIVCANAGDSRAVFARRPEALSSNSNSNSNDSLNLNDSTDSGNGQSTTTVGKAIPLSFDHKPDDEEEEKRVRNAGGYVTGGRVEGDLAVSRGLGDFRFKQMSVVLNNTQLYPDEEEDTATTAAAAAAATAAFVNKSTDMATDDEGDSADESENNQSSIPLTDSMRSKPLEFPPGDQKVSPIPDVTTYLRNHERDEYVVVACDGIWDVVSNQQCVAELDEIMYAEGEHDLGLVSEEVRIVEFLFCSVLYCFFVVSCFWSMDCMVMLYLQLVIPAPFCDIVLPLMRKSSSYPLIFYTQIDQTHKTKQKYRSWTRVYDTGPRTT